MIATRHYLKLIGIGGLVLVGATACNVDFALDTEGSGVAETVSFDFDSFDEVDVSQGFEAQITVQQGPPSVEVTVDDNLVDRLDVELDGTELNIDMKRGSISFNVRPTVVITMPEITELDVSGGASAELTGVTADLLKVDVSGAGTAVLDGQVESLTIDGSGGSDVTMVGTADALELDLSGAASLDLQDSTVDAAVVDMSGGSTATFGEIDRVMGDLSGGSTMTVPSGTDVAVSTSGGAQVERS